ncbi:ABC transporter substrate-binding protein [Pseudoclavibacter endophyticus]|uniref:Methionine ABC transporter substrate-binding protein n=1 Tax=Pseudoclavibacter endophyticus TaxID=1778590 RepID=A0A6H9WHH9_9MICO|nr:MetQ/NlpA family ABC transporter substrate-binding protein [Pseudoclavibacter endophyticus]KAB1648753.1 methionine ABC transporter substrate-binding protein [Pseudoclavibacter endophyticus]GGA68804.1 ABC transporter substrate-binding protein [Pseudoclavibacter endophyticus]
MPRFTKALAALGAAALVGTLAACAPAGDDDVIRIGVVGAADPEWALFTEAAAAEGITVEVIDFGEYTQPNPATTAGDIDINQFQHIQFLAQHNVDSGDDLQPLGSTAIYPLGLYSDKHDDVAAIPEGGRIGIPNDIVNQARGLLVLQSAGLVELEGGGNAYSTVDDIDTAASKVEIVPIDADKIGTSMPDLEAAIMNNDFLEAAGFQAADAIAEDDPADPAALPYVNIFATTADNVDNETYLRLVELYHESQDVLDAVQEGAGGTAEFVNLPASELQASLEETQAAYAETKE